MVTGIVWTGVVLLGLGLVALALCLHALLRLRAWHKVNRPGAAHYRKTLLPPLAATVILTGCLAALAWGGRPVPEAQLLPVADRVSGIERHSAPGPAGGSGASCYILELENSGERLYLPDGYPFDPAGFLAAAERQAVSFRYAPVHGRSQVFEIQTAGGVYLSYGDGCAGAWRSVGLELAGAAVLFLWLAGLSLRLPAALYRPPDELLIERSERRRRFARQSALTAAGLAALVLLGGLRPQIDKIPGRIVLPLTRQAALELNGAWREYGVSESGIPWYRIQEGASTSFHGYALNTPESEGESRQVWAEGWLADQRDYLQEGFVDAPDPAFGPFLEELSAAPPTAGGVNYLWSEGMAKSTGGSWNHFLLVLMPEQGCMLMIHSSSWSMEPEELEAYAQAWVRDIPAGLELRG